MLGGAIIPSAVVWTVVGTWWLGDVVGVLVLAPLFLAWQRSVPQARPERLRAEAMASLLLLSVVLYAIFGHKVQPDMANRWIAYVLVLKRWAGPRSGTGGAAPRWPAW
ncbi:MASE1 domain-containing protein [Massilia sp. B-10]|nr:MASE1 domain-containing protein [Massilia sp. B-10]